MTATAPTATASTAPVSPRGASPGSAPGIAFTDDPAAVTPDHLVGLLRRTPAGPSLEERYAVLHRASRAVLALDHGLLVGLAIVGGEEAVIEVRPGHRERGIESELVRRLAVPAAVSPA